MLRTLVHRGSLQDHPDDPAIATLDLEVELGIRRTAKLHDDVAEGAPFGRAVVDDHNLVSGQNPACFCRPVWVHFAHDGNADGAHGELNADTGVALRVAIDNFGLLACSDEKHGQE